jgi:peptidoglycan hydrolase-like protein with peptidoglycan-binding domain
VRSVQVALEDAGYDPGPIDGIIGRRTAAALVAFQKSKGLPSGQLTVATLDALRVKANQ